MYVCRTLLLLTFTFSLIWELSRGFAAMPACYGVNGLFFLFFFLLVLFLKLPSAFISFIIILIFTHVRFLVILVIHPYSFVVYSLCTAYLPLYLIYLQDKSKMRLWLSMQI